MRSIEVFKTEFSTAEILGKALLIFFFLQQQLVPIEPFASCFSASSMFKIQGLVPKIWRLLKIYFGIFQISREKRKKSDDDWDIEFL